MKKLLILLALGALAALLLAGGLSSALGGLRGQSWADMERERLAVERAQAVAPVATFAAQALALAPVVALYGALLIAGAWGSLALARFRRERRPDGAGRLPVPVELLPAASVGALDRYHERELAAAQRQLVPHSLNYSPHYSHRADADGVPVHPADVAPAEPTLPGVTDYADTGHAPNVNSIMLGLGPGGQPVTVPMKSLWHIGVAGPTGNGKSNIARLVVAQLQHLGAKVCIGDPKFTEYDAEQDEDWRPIASRLHLEPAVSAKEIGALLRWAAHPETGEIARRLELRRRGERVGAPLFVYLDELPWQAKHVLDFDQLIGDLVRVGRGVGLFLLVGTQDMLAKTVDLSAERDNFRTGFYLGGDRKTGSILLSMPQREVSEPEGLGVAWLRSAATQPARQVRVPYASNRAVYRLLSDDAPAMPAITRQPTGSQREALISASGSGKPADARAAQVIALFREGKTIPEITRMLFEEPTGRGYTASRNEVERIIRETLR